jgi:uncharacterized membrane protein
MTPYDPKNPYGQQSPYGQMPPQSSGTAPGPFGLQPNIAATLAYIPTCFCFVGLVISIVFFLTEKNNRFVRFHALQGIILHVLFFVLGVGNVILGKILVAVIGNTGSFVNLLLSVVLLLIEFGVFGFLMFKAFSNEQMKLPIIGDLAEKNA